ncbi:C40 family peptidase [Krasilnikoviella flava]|uniref:Cell wall-associated hydrolase, NlpC family n=1 Tax=Krasilnikoviella flava TaxID=526729 RepID=A0A1T5LJG4_9MICO|nr:C40 family peptidase [Krasilnikoviella flava]SKC76101.1 Cell wall-associated hydrolase, NlpC family [Krasilnikoviella flava]
MPTSHAPARPGTAAVAARRPRRAIIALAVAGALTGGTLIAVAPHASASTGSTSAGVSTVAVHAAKGKVKPRTVFSASKHTMVKNSGRHRPAFTMKATHSGKAISGRAKLVMNGKVVSTKRLHSGKATFKPVWGQYKVGKNKVRILVAPTSDNLANKSSRTTGVTAKKPGSPVVRIASSKVGARYVHGATGPNAFDCSGFTSYVYKKAIGKTMPRTSSAQKHVGKRVSRANAKPGDLIWTPGHVAIYIGNGKQIDAGRPGVGVVKRNIWQSNPTFIRVSSKAV